MLKASLEICCAVISAFSEDYHSQAKRLDT